MEPIMLTWDQTGSASAFEASTPNFDPWETLRKHTGKRQRLTRTPCSSPASPLPDETALTFTMRTVPESNPSISMSGIGKVLNLLETTAEENIKFTLQNRNMSSLDISTTLLELDTPTILPPNLRLIISNALDLSAVCLYMFKTFKLHVDEKQRNLSPYDVLTLFATSLLADPKEWSDFASAYNECVKPP